MYSVRWCKGLFPYGAGDTQEVSTKHVSDVLLCPATDKKHFRDFRQLPGLGDADYKGDVATT